MVHSALPELMTAAADDALRAAGVGHTAHGEGAVMSAGEAAAADPRTLALLGPFRSREVCEVVEATAPAGVPLIAPIATWAGVTRDDEPGCDDDPADHRGTLLRMVARDTEVAARLAADVRASGSAAFVIAGDHEYGAQLDGQLRMAGLPRVDSADEAGLIVLCALPGDPEIAAVRDIPEEVAVVAFDGVQGEDLGPHVGLEMVLPFAPIDGVAFDHMLYGAEQTRRAASLIVDALRAGARDRPGLLAAMRASGPFDEHGDPVDPPVWLWSVGDDWTLTPRRAI
jgi:hypothetical protein